MGRAIQSFKEKGYDDEILLDSGLILKEKTAVIMTGSEVELYFQYLI